MISAIKLVAVVAATIVIIGIGTVIIDSRNPGARQTTVSPTTNTNTHDAPATVFQSPVDWLIMDSRMSDVSVIKDKIPVMTFTYPPNYVVSQSYDTLTLSERVEGPSPDLLRLDWSTKTGTSTPGAACLYIAKNDLTPGVVIDSSSTLRVDGEDAVYLKTHTTADNGTFYAGYVCGTYKVGSFNAELYPTVPESQYPILERVLETLHLLAN